MKLYILNDDRCETSAFKCEHGFSVFIELPNKNILFDFGQTNIFIDNANKLGLDLDSTDCAVLSHGDYDHSNGLMHFDKKVDLICHPDFVLKRISKRTGNLGGINQDYDCIRNKYNLIESTKPYFIDDNIVFLGEIPRNIKFEKEKNLPMNDLEGNTYKHFDDSALAMKTKEGIVVVSGCSHSGICNIIEYAKKVLGADQVYAVIGGFHLKELDEQTNKTIEYFKKNNIKNIYLAHCTSDIVCDEFQKKLENVEIVKTGKIYQL